MNDWEKWWWNHNIKKNILSAEKANSFCIIESTFYHFVCCFMWCEDWYDIFFILIFRYDEGKDGFLDLAELKVMMEKLQAPQTHLGLKAMIAEVDEDQDGKISFREFLLIYR